MRNNDDSSSNKKLSKSFIWIAWLMAFGLLIFAFQDYLDNQWNPNTSPESSFSSAGKAQVVLKQNRQGHYITAGAINNQPVLFLLDTGATQVSIPQVVANTLNLPTYGSYPVQTANGTVNVYRTKIDTLTFGNITLKDVQGHINPGMKSNEILLGMSALKRVEFRQTGKQLILTER